MSEENQSSMKATPAGGGAGPSVGTVSREGSLAPDGQSTAVAGSDYIAFISYAHGDNREDGKKWADWLESVIENYPIPPEFSGDQTSAGTVPAHMPEVFLDRAVLGAGGELTDKLEAGLSQSRFLVVICSPRSAASKYVNLEIDRFIKAKGVDWVIPVVIDGDDGPLGSSNCWVPASLMKAGGVDDGELPLYVDFRVQEATGAGRVVTGAGWTDPAEYASELRRDRRYTTAVQRKLVMAYAAEHGDARIKLIASLLGLTPRQLSRQEAAEELEEKKVILRRQSWMIAASVSVAILLGTAGTIAYRFYRVAERERAKAERSLQMIGDAHEQATRLVADVLVDLQARLEPAGQKEALENARRIVNEQLDENELTGDDPDSRHMQSVVLNSRGYLARCTGDLDGAARFYGDALRIRERLLEKDASKPMYQHNLAVSHDNLGDLHVALARVAAGQGQDPGVELARAATEYRESLGLAQQLASRPDATPQWKHDLAVSYFKLGDALFEGGDKETALKELEAGFPLAEEVAASDPEYPKWQAHLGLYCYEIGRIHALAGRSDEALGLLERGRNIFEALRQRGRLSTQYAEWLEMINEALDDLK